jgi:hypothetical protein
MELQQARDRVENLLTPLAWCGWLRFFNRRQFAPFCGMPHHLHCIQQALS